MSQKHQPEWLHDFCPGVLVTPPCQYWQDGRHCGWPSTFYVRGNWYCAVCAYKADVRCIVRKARRRQKKLLEE